MSYYSNFRFASHLYIAGIAVVIPLLCYQASRAASDNPAEKIPSGAWRNDTGEIFIISGDGKMMGSVRKFSGIVYKKDSNIIVRGYDNIKSEFLCVYNLQTHGNYAMNWVVVEKSPSNAYCPEGIFYALRELE